MRLARGFAAGIAPNRKGYQHMNTSVTNHSTATAPERWAPGSLTSKDDTTIGYRQIGHGPGVLLLRGIMESAQSHLELAERLADTITVYLPDRRGRGRSARQGLPHPQGSRGSGRPPCQTGRPTQVFGVSAGAIICLQAALTLPAIHRAAIFEPPLLLSGSVSTALPEAV
jgi:pimeloyl-ACP methyl ester carboxylesterase